MAKQTTIPYRMETPTPLPPAPSGESVASWANTYMYSRPPPLAVEPAVTSGAIATLAYF